jgi:hypothetical protein
MSAATRGPVLRFVSRNLESALRPPCTSQSSIDRLEREPHHKWPENAGIVAIPQIWPTATVSGEATWLWCWVGGERSHASTRVLRDRRCLRIGARGGQAARPRSNARLRPDPLRRSGRRAARPRRGFGTAAHRSRQPRPLAGRRRWPGRTPEAAQRLGRRRSRQRRPGATTNSRTRAAAIEISLTEISPSRGRLAPPLLLLSLERGWAGSGAVLQHLRRAGPAGRVPVESRRLYHAQRTVRISSRMGERMRYGIRMELPGVTQEQYDALHAQWRRSALMPRASLLTSLAQHREVGTLPRSGSRKPISSGSCRASPR